MTVCPSLQCAGSSAPTTSASDHFLGMLDTIVSVARFAFRRHSRWRRQQLMDESIGYAFVMFLRLVNGAKSIWRIHRPGLVCRSSGPLGPSCWRTPKRAGCSFAFCSARKGFSVRSLAERDHNRTHDSGIVLPLTRTRAIDCERTLIRSRWR